MSTQKVIKKWIPCIFALASLLAVCLSGCGRAADETETSLEALTTDLHTHQTILENDTERAYIFVGDSRTLGMSLVVDWDPADVCIAENQKGFDWFEGQAVFELEAELKEDPHRIVVLALGVNDLYRSEDYIEAYHQLFEKYPLTCFYIAGIGPVNQSLADDYDFYIEESDVLAFNEVMQAAFSDCWIDTHTYLETNGFDTVDGLHYTDDTYMRLYDFIKAAIEEKEQRK